MKQQWVFDGVLWGDSEKRGTVRVQRNSGHTPLLINRETNVISAGEFVYYATWRGDEGGVEKFALSEAGLATLRKQPKAAESEPQP